MLDMLKDEVGYLGKEVAKNAGNIMELQQHQEVEGPSCTVNASLSKLKLLNFQNEQCLRNLLKRAISNFILTNLVLNVKYI